MILKLHLNNEITYWVGMKDLQEIIQKDQKYSSNLIKVYKMFNFSEMDLIWDTFENKIKYNNMNQIPIQNSASLDSQFKLLSVEFFNNCITKEFQPMITEETKTKTEFSVFTPRFGSMNNLESAKKHLKFVRGNTSGNLNNGDKLIQKLIQNSISENCLDALNCPKHDRNEDTENGFNFNKALEAKNSFLEQRICNQGKIEPNSFLRSIHRSQDIKNNLGIFSLANKGFNNYSGINEKDLYSTYSPPKPTGDTESSVFSSSTFENVLTFESCSFLNFNSGNNQQYEKNYKYESLEGKIPVYSDQALIGIMDSIFKKSLSKLSEINISDKQAYENLRTHSVQSVIFNKFFPSPLVLLNLRKELTEISKRFEAYAQEYFSCPISQNKMYDPVIAEDGHTYERSEILKWFNFNNISPITKQRLKSKNLLSNFILKNQIVYLLPFLGRLMQLLQSLNLII